MIAPIEFRERRSLAVVGLAFSETEKSLMKATT
jgi:hypothetical protein